MQEATTLELILHLEWEPYGTTFDDSGLELPLQEGIDQSGF